MPTPALDPKTVLEIDGYLEPDIPNIVKRYDLFKQWKDTIEQHEGGYDNFTKAYLNFGFNVGNDGQVVYREWAPNATEANLIGDFSTLTVFASFKLGYSDDPSLDDWSRSSHPMKKNQFGIWEITIPSAPNGACAIPHDSKVKVCSSFCKVYSCV